MPGASIGDNDAGNRPQLSLLDHCCPSAMSCFTMLQQTCVNFWPKTYLWLRWHRHEALQWRHLLLQGFCMECYCLWQRILKIREKSLGLQNTCSGYLKCGMIITILDSTHTLSRWKSQSMSGKNSDWSKQRAKTSSSMSILYTACNEILLINWRHTPCQTIIRTWVDAVIVCFRPIKPLATLLVDLHCSSLILEFCHLGDVDWCTLT